MANAGDESPSTSHVHILTSNTFCLIQVYDTVEVLTVEMLNT